MSQQQNFATGGSAPVVPNIQFIAGNDELKVGPNPATFTINLIGDTTKGVHVTNTAPFTEQITIDNATTTQKGVVLLSTNPQALAGTDTTTAMTPQDVQVKVGAQTLHGLAYGAGNAAAIQWLGEASNGQIPIGSTGNSPQLGFITSLDGSLIVTNGAGSIDLSITDTHTGTATTIDAVTANIITIPLGATPATFQFDARVKTFDTTSPTAAGYNIFSTFVTDGTTATLIGNQSIFNESPVLSAGDSYFIASGNNAVLQVLGVLGFTLHWSAETEIT